MLMSDLSRRVFVAQGMAAAAVLVALPGCKSQNNGGNQNNSVSQNNEVVGADLTLPLDLDLPGQSSDQKSGGPQSLAPDPSNPDPYVDQVGRGCDTTFDELRRPMITGTLIRSPIAPTEFDVRNGLKWKMIETQTDYYSLTRKSARAKGRYKLFKARGSGSKASEFTSNSYSLHICALARRVDQSFQLNKDTIRLTKEAEQVILGERDPNRRLRDWGDTFVAGVIPGSELFIDIKFETSSRSAKTDCRTSISASYDKMVSGSGSYSQVISKAKFYKTVTVEIVGLDDKGVPKQYTADEAQKMVEHFLATPDKQSSVWEMNLRPVGDLSLRGRRLDWVDFQAIRRRENFLAEAETSMTYLHYGEIDAEYVRDNSSEFDKATFDRASKDLQDIGVARKKLLDIGEDAYAAFRNDGKTGAKFVLARFDGVMPELEEYVQRERTPPPPPKKRPKPERSRPERF
jgi:hypothetical protein